MQALQRRPELIARTTLLLLAMLWAAVLLRSGAFFLTHFEEANIARTERLLHGHFELWGPETDAGPRLPGPFFTLLLAPAVALGGLDGTVIFLTLSFAGAIALLSLLVHRRAGLFSALQCSAALALLPSLC